MLKLGLKLSAAGAAIGMLAGLIAGTGNAVAQTWPTRPIEIIVPFAPGGSVDITFRLIAPSLSKRLGQQVLIVNKPGGGATIGMLEVAKASPDGYTLGAASFAFGANQLVLEKLPYDPIKDFTAVTMVASSAMLFMVNPKSPAKNVKEFIEWAKSKPGDLNFGSVGVGSSGHLITELFIQKTGIKMTHVPFTAGPLGPLSQDQIQLQIGPIPSSIPWVKDGRLISLGVTSLKPDPTVPGMPTVAETVPGFDSFEWPGIVGPANMPKAVVDKIQQAVFETVNEPEIKAKLFELGSVGVGSKPEEFGVFIKSQIDTWNKLGRTFSPEKK